MQRKATEDMREAVNEAHSKANSELKETVKEAQVQSTVQFQKLFTGQTQLRGQMAGIEARFVDYNGEVDERLKMMNEGIPDLVKSHCVAETQLQMEQAEDRILAAAISNTEETVEEVRQSLPALVEPLEKRLANQGELITTNTVVNANCAKEMKHMKDRQAKFEKQLAELSQPVAFSTAASVLANNNPSTRPTFSQVTSNPRASQPQQGGLLPRQPRPSNPMYSDRPDIPTSTEDLKVIGVAQTALKFIPVFKDEIEFAVVEMYGSDMDRAYIGAAWAFMRRRMQIDTPTLSKISVLKAWIPEGTSALVVKFKNRADVNLVNRFKKNLDPEAKVFDVVPPCCEDIEKLSPEKSLLTT